MTEDPDFLFRDITDWSVLDVGANAPYRYNEREQHRAWADNCSGHQAIPHGQLRPLHTDTGHAPDERHIARQARDRLPHARRQDGHQGRNRHAAGRGNSRQELEPLRPAHHGEGSKLAGPGAVWNGAALTRCLEFSAREKGVRFMLNRRMTEIVREQQFSGRVLGIKASYTPEV